MQRVLAVVVITKKNCIQIFAASMRVISAKTGNPSIEYSAVQKSINQEGHCHGMHDFYNLTTKSSDRLVDICYFCHQSVEIIQSYHARYEECESMH